MINPGEVYVGTISEVFPPDHPENLTEYQYLYLVKITSAKMCMLDVKCIKMDTGAGGVFNFEDTILPVLTQVFVTFPFGDTTSGVIMGARRTEPSPQEVEGTSRYKKQFNQIIQSISQDGVYKVGHVSQVFSQGASFTLDKSTILIDDGGPAGKGSASQSIEIDAIAKTIKIKAGDWTLDADTGVTINVKANCSISCANATIDAKGSAEVNANSGVKVTAKGEVSVESLSKVAVKAPSVELGQTPAGQVLNTASQPTCYVTGIPFNGAGTIKAGP